ncbi:MAG: glutathione S-transferase [Rhodospirillaceae bacterium]|nr:MAG: glutathione S-transferase [Rhodospirillaceae bacterium]
MLKLYYNPGSCSLASHAALEEAGLDYEVELVDLTKDAQYSVEYRDKNPWARVPALQIDGQILTENVAILSYIADCASQTDLLPLQGLEKARAFEWLALLSSSVHVAFRPIFRPNRLAQTEQGQVDVAATGLAALQRALALLDRKLGDGPYALGNQFSLCDLYLFVFALWSRRPVLEGKLGALPHLDAFGERMVKRPSVGAAMAQEGMVWLPASRAPRRSKA